MPFVVLERFWLVVTVLCASTANHLHLTPVAALSPRTVTTLEPVEITTLSAHVLFVVEAETALQQPNEL